MQFYRKKKMLTYVFFWFIPEGLAAVLGGKTRVHMRLLVRGMVQ
jgi:hypothetical protein